MELKRIVICLIVGLITATAWADTKVLDKSAKKPPEWLGGAPNGFLIVTVRGATLEQAQNRAQEEIVERIMRAAGSNFSMSLLSESSEIATNGGVDSRDEFRKTTQLRTAQLPFLKGVSLSKAIDTYWVRLLDKPTKREFIEFSVKYPFTRMEQENLSAELEQMESAHDAELAQLENSVENIEAYDDIKARIGRCDALAAYFIDAPRQARVKACRQRYADLYKSVALTGMQVDKGKIVCGLTINGHLLRTSLRPTVESTCASNIRVGNRDGEYTVTFSTEDCIDYELNTLTISFRINNKVLKETFNI